MYVCVYMCRQELGFVSKYKVQTGIYKFMSYRLETKPFSKTPAKTYAVLINKYLEFTLGNG